MSPFAWYCLCAAGTLAVPLAVLHVVVFVISLVRTLRFERKKGWQADSVPHTLPLELYHSCSVDMDAQKVRCCLAEKGVQFNERELDLGFFGSYDHLEDDMLRVNPNGTQPTLVHDGHPIIGIEEMITYMEGHIEGPPLLPTNPAERQDVCRWIQQASHGPLPGNVDDKGNPIWTLGMATRVLSIPAVSAATKSPDFCTALRAVLRHPNPLPEFLSLPYSLARHFRTLDTVPPRKAAKCSFRVVAKALDELETHLANEGRRFLVADTFTLADICIVANLNRLEILGILELILSDRHPKLGEYWERVKTRESFGSSFRPRPSSRGLEELERSFTRFRKEVAEHGLVAAFKLDEDGEEEED